MMDKKSLYTTFTLLSILGYTWTVWNFFERSSHKFVPDLCLFKDVTGFPCPSCGTTRSVSALIQGNIKDAVLINPFGILIAAAMLLIPFWIILDTITKKDGFFRFYLNVEHLFTTNKWIIISSIAIVLLNWFWNIEKGL